MSSAHQDVFVQPNTDINIINEAMTIIGVSPIISKKKAHGSYMVNKVKRIETTIKQKLETATGKRFGDDESELIHVTQLKQKFHSLTKKSEKVQVLTVLPVSWSIKRIEDEFGASNYMPRKAKKLVN